MIRDMNYYINQFPAWMKEDDTFLSFYTKIAEIFIAIQETKEKILNAFVFSNKEKKAQNYTANIDILSNYFNINRNFYLEKGYKITALDDPEKNKSPYRLKNGTFNQNFSNNPININISNKILLRMIKFQFLKNNFDGTIKSLVDNYKSLFSEEIESGDWEIQFEEGKINVNDEQNPVYLPELTINLNMAVRSGLTEEEYKEEKEEAELFLNGAYSFNLLGTKMKYTVAGASAEFIWDESVWDTAIWKL